MDAKQNLSKILLLICVFFSCANTAKLYAQRIDINHIVDFYIDWQSSHTISFRKGEFNSDNYYLWLGITDNDMNGVSKMLYISDICYGCPNNELITEKDTMVLYKDFKVAIYSDNDENKKYLLDNFHNTSKTDKVSIIFYSHYGNIMINYRFWTIGFDDDENISYFCASRGVKKLLGIEDNVDGCGE